MTTKSRIVLVLLVLTLVFLVGFVPQFSANRALQRDLEQARTEIAGARLQTQIDDARNLAGRMLLAASERNYGDAADKSTEYFNSLRELSNNVDKPSLTAPVSALLAERDSITRGLAQGSSSIISDLYSLLERTYDLPDVYSVTQ